MVMLAGQVAKLCQWSLNTVLPSDPGPCVPLSIAELQAVAVIAPYFIGDTVLSTLLLQNLSRQLPPACTLDVIAPPALQNLLETLPNLAHCEAMPTSERQRLKLLRGKGYDAVFLLRYSLPWANVLAKAGVRYRIGFDLERFGLEKLKTWGGLMTHTAPSGHFDAPTHQARFYHAMLTHLGLAWDPSIRPLIATTAADAQRARELLAPLPAPHVILHITAGSPGKQWPLEYWQEVASELHEHHGASVIALGTPKDAATYQALLEAANVPILNLCGQTTLRETAALCRQSDLIITVDTALAHIAAAVDTPRLLVIYGPTNPVQWRPMVSEKTRLEQVFLQMSCRPCITRHCYHQSCLAYLTPERVLQHADRLLQAPTRHPAERPLDDKFY